MTGSKLLWCDLETTGLDPQNGSILSVGLAETNEDLEFVNEFEQHVWVSPVHLEAQLSPYVREMHEYSGILTRVKDSTVRLADVEQQAIRWLYEHDYRPGKAILAGSSVHFDRKWIESHMPGLYAWLHHRIVDVSSFREMMRFWRPSEVVENLNPAHTPLADIRSSIKELRRYRDLFYNRP